jgi:hypothetical protein
VVVVADQTGLRERKKQQTWCQIVQTARRLFQEHGFGTVTDIARGRRLA